MRHALLALLLIPAACGYSAGSLMPAGVRDVAVEVFGNETFYRNDEITFTRHLSRLLIERAGARVVAPARAQAIIRGRILAIGRYPFVDNPMDAVLDSGLVVTVEVVMEDPVTGEPLIPAFQVKRLANQIVARGESLQSAIDDAVRLCAEDAVNRFEAHSFLRGRAGRGSVTRDR